VLAFCFLMALVLAGCSKDRKVAPSVSEPPEMSVIHPQPRTISRVVGQPSFVQAYERSSIYPKMTAYIEKWNVDIGDRVQKGDVLADLFVPELRENWSTKKAAVEFSQERVKFAIKNVDVAGSQLEAAKARLKEAQAILGKYEAEVERWYIQVERIRREVERQVIAPQILLESENELKADKAAAEAARATIAKATAEVAADQAALARADVNVGVARADLAMAQSESRRLEAMVGYLKIFAPFDGIVVERNTNTFDFVLPRTGDPTAESRAPHLSPSGQAAPMYVVDRTDIVRIFVDVPERDANYVHIGSEAHVKLWAYRDEWIPASVTRLAWALNLQSRTMRAEIDIPNPDMQVRPGMYAYGKILVERPNVLSVPKAALTYVGGKTFYWRYEDGKAMRTEVQTGTSDGQWVEITNRRVKTETPEEEVFAPVETSESILTGNTLSTLTEGAKVKVVEQEPPSQKKANTTPGALQKAK
jgi:multidrug efflux pump subunit AcrA (membrane-fusion protein)